MPQPLNYVGGRIYGFKILGDQINGDGDRTLLFEDDQGTQWSITAPHSPFAGEDFSELEFYDGRHWHKVGPGTDYPDKEPMGHIAQAQEKPPDPIPITEDDVRGSPDDPVIDRVPGGQPTSINTNPDAPYSILTSKLGRVRTAEEREADAEEEARAQYIREESLRAGQEAKEREAEEQARAEQAQGQQNPQPVTPSEEAQDPDLAKKWAEERGIEETPAPPPSSWSEV